jgi:hypothetical protein
MAMKLNNMKGGKHKRGRPPTKPVVFKDGFYIEVRNRATDAGSGIKIGKATEAEMLVAIEEYRKIKLVVVLGEYRNGERVSTMSSKKKKKAA